MTSDSKLGRVYAQDGVFLLQRFAVARRPRTPAKSSTGKYNVEQQNVTHQVE